MTEGCRPQRRGCLQTDTNGCAFGRFGISFTGMNGQGETTNGPALNHFSDGVIFDVFGDNNLFVQIQNLCGTSGHYGVDAFAGTTDVEYTLTVTDTATNQMKTYENPAGQNFAVTDTQAFPACP